ncbi:UNVERIFIED_CONTAM: hypothetical protein Sindi_3019600, partial [Sesamum indicum]
AKKEEEEKRRGRSHHHSDDDSADLRHKRRNRKAYSNSNSDVSASNDSRVVRGEKRSKKKCRKHRHEED